MMMVMSTLRIMLEDRSVMEEGDGREKEKTNKQRNLYSRRIG